MNDPSPTTERPAGQPAGPSEAPAADGSRARSTPAETAETGEASEGSEAPPPTGAEAGRRVPSADAGTGEPGTEPPRSQRKSGTRPGHGKAPKAAAAPEGAGGVRPGPGDVTEKSPEPGNSAVAGTRLTSEEETETRPGRGKASGSVPGPASGSRPSAEVIEVRTASETASGPAGRHGDAAAPAVPGSPLTDPGGSGASVPSGGGDAATAERRARLSRRLLRRRRGREEGRNGVSATVRLDRRTKNLTKRLQPGEIAVIDHVDLDRVSAEALVSCEVGGVVNVAPSISGRYPNMGPQILVEAGIPLVDDVGPEIFTRLAEGDQVRIEDEVVHRGEEVVAKGTAQTAETVDAALTEAKAGLSHQIEAFAANTMEYIKRERDLLIDGVGVPEVKTRIEGRHALIVVRGYHYREDIAALRPYIREYRPVLIGVDGGADALLEAGYRPDMIVGDMDSVSDDALTCGAEIVVHAYRDGRAPGLKRVHELDQEAVVFPATATSEDIAMLLADDKGATLIVAVGTHANMVEFLDKGRAGMASTFLTRLRVGSKLVDAKGVSRLYRSRISTGSLLFLVLGAFIAMTTAVFMSPAGDVIRPLLADRWHAFLFWLTGLFT
nr:hypothetical protein GCM10010200_087210 [Actinomadura rugatobispora]